MKYWKFFIFIASLTAFFCMATTDAIFDEPNKTTIDTETIDMINSVTSDGIIYGAFYFISDVFDEHGRSLASALESAANRGVEMHFITAANKYGSSAALSNITSMPNVSLTKCTGACISGPRGNSSAVVMHNKFWAVRKSLASDYYVMIGSHNYATSQQSKHEQALIIRDDQAAFDILVDYFEDMIAYKDTPINDYYRYAYSTNEKFYFFPKSSGDLIVEILDNIDPAAGYCNIHIAMSYFTNGRIEIVDKLKELSTLGCYVFAALDHEDSITPLRLFNNYVNYYDRNNGSTQMHNVITVDMRDETIHSKYFTIDAIYYNGTRQNLTWSGSHNFSAPALTMHDESLVKTYYKKVYNQFLSNWRSLPNCYSSVSEIQASLILSGFNVNAPGDDLVPAYANGEWIEFKNTGSKCIDLSGYTVQDAAGHGMTFPKDIILDPEKRIRIFSGCKEYPADVSWGDGENHYYYLYGKMNQTTACGGIWNNGGDTLTLRNTSSQNIISSNIVGSMQQ